MIKAINRTGFASAKVLYDEQFLGICYKAIDEISYIDGKISFFYKIHTSPDCTSQLIQYIHRYFLFRQQTAFFHSFYRIDIFIFTVLPYYSIRILRLSLLMMDLQMEVMVYARRFVKKTVVFSIIIRRIAVNILSSESFNPTGNPTLLSLIILRSAI